MVATATDCDRCAAALIADTIKVALSGRSKYDLMSQGFASHLQRSVAEAIEHDFRRNVRARFLERVPDCAG
jgi:hypothetical protein